MNLYKEMQGRKTGIEDGAVFHETAQVGENVYVGAFTCVSEKVRIGAGSQIYPQVYIGKNVKILSHVNITGNTSISDECEIYSFASIGSAPQDLKFKGEKTKLIIGKKNKIRELRKDPRTGTFTDI